MGDTEDWLFPGMGPTTALPKKQIAEMHRRFRADPEGRTCGACQYYGRWTHNTRAYAKCDVFGHTSGRGSDWNRAWPACGRFTVPEPDPPGLSERERWLRRMKIRESVKPRW